jgi:hypothetical protein
MEKLHSALKKRRLAKERDHFQDMAEEAGVDLSESSPEDCDEQLARKLDENRRVGEKEMDKVREYISAFSYTLV